jgi:hypothetical protein
MPEITRLFFYARTKKPPFGASSDLRTWIEMPIIKSGSKKTARFFGLPKALGGKQ